MNDRTPREPNLLSLPFADVYWDRYRANPRSVSSEWRAFFENLERSQRSAGDQRAPAPPPVRRTPKSAADAEALQDRVDQLIRAYRVRGHMIAELDPLGRPRPRPAELDLETYGLGERELDLGFSVNTIAGVDRLSLRDILRHLQVTYCRSIGVQFMHIDDGEMKGWLQDRMERSRNRIELSHAEQVRVLERLTDAVVFEEFLRKKFVGAKSFSLEGAESLIPLLDLAIEKAASDGVREIVLGMAHRGRLNVLANILGKNPRAIFAEFEDSSPEESIGRGDVKYHLGYSAEWPSLAGQNVHLSLCFNPSHLEAVDPVVIGRLRAKQDRVGDSTGERGLAVVIHGDAAFAGEGVVQETLNLSQLPGYHVGGTLHVIVNNQIGFTTPPESGRSSQYATDVAKMLQVPIFHVNGEEPEAVAQVTHLALDYRRRFARDVVIDMYCYRRRGHNEGDEPSFTQPLLYREIERRDTVYDAYLEHLLSLGGLSRQEAEGIAERRRAHLEEELAVARQTTHKNDPGSPAGIWRGFAGGPEDRIPDVETGVEPARLRALLEATTRTPDDFHSHPKIPRLMRRRLEMAQGERPVDWAAAEALAFASVATEGARVRFSGQDSGRGTFSQRHAILHDVATGERWEPLNHLTEDQAPVEIIDSPLSEFGVLGFEYGYSLDCPEGLVLWEAQFGDFINSAQVVIDQFIASAEDKWRRLSGIVLLLPHGFEGQGPEHSSARLERFLLLAAEDNIQVAQPTTPAQYFHLLRRQVLRPWRKPLVVMTPKSLLRHPRVVNDLSALSEGRFRRVLPDERPQEHAQTEVRRLLLCSGKVYYDLAARREQLGRWDVAIVRFEQLYPLRDAVVAEALAPYRDGVAAIWVQDEPENMGAWRSLRSRFGERLLDRLPLSLVSRPASASPATGSSASHRLEQELLLASAFGDS